MSKVDELIQELCPDGVERVALGDPMVSSAIYSGGTPSKSRSEYWEGGTIPWMSSGEVNKETVFQTDTFITQEGLDGSSAKMVPPVAVILALAGQGKTRGKVARNQIELCTNQSLASIIPGENLDRDYLYHFLKGEYENLRAISSSDGSRGGLTLKMIKEFEIPLPPLEVQEEVVRILDQFVELDREFEEEIAGREKQFGIVRDSLLMLDDFQRVRLGEIGSVAMCKRIFKKETDSTGDVPFFKIGTFGKEADSFIPQELFEDYKSRYPYPEPGDLLLSASGSIGRVVEFDGSPSYFQDSNIVWLKHDESILKNSFLKYCYQIVDWTTEGGTIQRLYNKNILNAQIPLPPLEVQEEIAAKLDTFTEYIDNLKLERELRQKQYEYYRDQLLDFKLKE